MKEYRLIKEYPGGPKLGFIYYAESLNPIESNYYVEIKEVTWQVEKWAEKTKHRFAKITTQSGRFDCNTPHEIYAVRRERDGVIFTVGDKITGTVSGIEWNNGFVRIVGFHVDLRGHLNFEIETGDILSWKVYNATESIEHYKEQEGGIITEDGVIIKGGGYFYVVCVEEGYGYNPYEVINQKWKKLPEGFKAFHDLRSATEYCILNNPCLTIRDVFHALSHFEENWKKEEYLLGLVETRINKQQQQQ